jgi:Family of unknown function (DUF6178)
MDKKLVKQVIDADPEAAVQILAKQDPLTAYELVFEHADPPAVVRAMPFVNAYLMVKGVGEADALPVLEMLAPEKIQGFFDLDVWNKDRISAKRMLEWIEILLEFEEDRFQEQISQMDDYLQVSILKKFVEVIKIDEPDENPFLETGNVFLTPDGRYAFRFSGEAEEIRLVYEYMMRIYRVDFDKFYWLAEGVFWELQTELEENAYQEKVGRLESMGFSDYYHALEVFSYVNPEKFKPAGKVEIHRAEDDPVVADAKTLTVLDRPGSLFLTALAAMDHGADSVQFELMTLVNTVGVANRIPFSDVQTVTRMARMTESYVSLGLEQVSGGGIEAAAVILYSKRLADLFKLGRSMVIRQARLLRPLLPKISADGSVKRVMFEAPFSDFIEGLLKTNPAIYSEGNQVGYVATLAELGKLRGQIDSLFALTSLLHDQFDFTPKRVRNLKLVGTNQPNPLNISYAPLFCTSFANDLLGREFGPESLTVEDCLELATHLTKSSDEARFKKQTMTKFYAWLTSTLDEVPEGAKEFFEDLFTQLAQQLSTFAESDFRDVRYLSTLIVKLPY